MERGVKMEDLKAFCRALAAAAAIYDIDVNDSDFLSKIKEEAYTLDFEFVRAVGEYSVVFSYLTMREMQHGLDEDEDQELRMAAFEELDEMADWILEKLGEEAE